MTTISFPITSQSAFDKAVRNTFGNIGSELVGDNVPSSAATVVNIDTSTYVIPNEPNLFLISGGSSAVEVILPEGLDSYTIGDKINIYVGGSGVVTITPDDTTLSGGASITTFTSAGAGSLMQIMKVDTNTWVAIPGGFSVSTPE